MAVIPIIQQTWDTNSIFNPTRMNNIETNIGIVSNATGVKYAEGVSVKDKIDDMNTSLANKLNILYKSYWTWNSVTSFSTEITSSTDSNSIIVYGARNGRGFLFICPNNNNEVLTVFNNTGCGITNGYDSSTKKHTITLTSPTSITGSSVLVCVLG